MYIYLYSTTIKFIHPPAGLHKLHKTQLAVDFPALQALVVRSAFTYSGSYKCHILSAPTTTPADTARVCS